MKSMATSSPVLSSNKSGYEVTAHINPTSSSPQSLPTVLDPTSDICDGSSSHLQCQWITQDGILCGLLFGSLDTLLTHLKYNHLNVESSDQSTTRICSWYLCQFSCFRPLEYRQHVMFHAHHSFLKQKGTEFQLKKNLPQCQLNSEMVNVVPPLDVELVCLWESGEGEGVRCDQTFEDVTHFYSHVKEHVEKDVIKCGWSCCSFRSNSKWNVWDHTRVHTQEKVVSCPKCGALFANNTKFRDHLLRQTTPTQCCSLCNKQFATERLLKEHFRKHVNTHNCPHCDMTCTSQSSLMYHIAYRHSDNKPHECPLCQRKFKTQYSLSEHLVTHQERSLPCSVSGCHYLGKSMKALQRHIRVEHSGNECLFCCHVCEERFTQGVYLTTHLKKFHGFTLPPGHSRFRYITGNDGLKRLQTVRLYDNDATPTT